MKTPAKMLKRNRSNMNPSDKENVTPVRFKAVNCGRKRAKNI